VIGEWAADQPAFTKIGAAVGGFEQDHVFGWVDRIAFLEQLHTL
jgi:hypothetical protein